MHMIPQGSGLSREAIAAGIVRDLLPLVEPGQVLELRALDAMPQGRGRPCVMHGYYDDPARLAADAAALDGAARGVYVTMNPIPPALLARAANRLTTGSGATADSDVIRRTLLLVDLDPVRPSGISSSSEEHTAALDRGREVRDHLSAQGWPAPVLASSGNGAHLLYRVDLPADQEARALVDRVLRALHLLHSDQAVAIDQTVGNAARIRRLLGTLARKGDALPDRPHRRSCIPEAPDRLDVVPRELLEALAARAPEEPTTTRTRGDRLDLPAWLEQYGILLAGPSRVATTGGGTAERYRIRCPGGHEDGAWAMQFQSGAIAAGCHHASCAGLDWRALRAHHEPPHEAPTTTRRPQSERPQPPPQAAPEPSSALQDPPAPGDAGRRPRGAVRPVLVRLAGIRPERPRYLWQGRFVLGGLGVIGGRPGLGKSLTLIALAAAVTTGRPVLPDEDPCPRGSVLLLTAEDSHPEIARRCLAAGADMDRVACLTLVEASDGQKRGLSLRDVSAIEEALDELGDVVLIGVDPITAFWDGSDSHKDTEVRGLLSALVEMAGRRGIALVAVAHHKKSQAGHADYQIGGSIALVAAARSVLHVFPDKADRRRRILAPGKNNLGPPAPSWSFAICDRGDGPAVEWVEAVEADANDLLAEAAVLGPPAPKRQSAEAWLRTRLAGGPVTASRLKEEGRAAGFTERTLDRARVEIGATAAKDRMAGPSFWALAGRESDLAPLGQNSEETPQNQKAPQSRQRGETSLANHSEETPQNQKAPSICVREDPPEDLCPAPVDLDSDSDRLEVWL